MWNNYFKIAVRNLFRNKVYGAMNLAGLTIGLACSLIILMFVKDEFSVDRFHTHHKDIYKLSAKYDFGGGFLAYFSFPPPMAKALEDGVPSVENAIRIEMNERVVVGEEGNSIYEENFWYTDPGFFSMFDFDLMVGDKKSALSNPFSVVISREVAERHFGKGSAIGKTLTINGTREFTVTGILADVPANSSLRFSMLASFNTLASLGIDKGTWEAGQGYFTYFVQIKPGTTPEALVEGSMAVLKEQSGATGEGYKEILAEPFADLYLHGATNSDTGLLSGSITYIRAFSGIGLLILMIAGINYVNLATARASLRGMEIGVRKVSGASRFQLLGQFLVESVILAVIASLFAAALIEFLLPGFNNLTGKSLSLNLLSDPLNVIYVMVAGLVTGVLAGLYPALFLSGMIPTRVLKGEFKSGTGARRLRQVLVVAQFAITTGLIFGTLVIHNQLDFLSDRDLGLNPENVIEIPLEINTKKSVEAFKTDLMAQPGVESVTWGSVLGIFMFETFNGAEYDTVKLKPSGGIARVLNTDSDFLRTFRVSLLAGENFSPEFDGSEEKSILMNETGIREYGWNHPQEAIGRQITLHGKAYTIIGVTNDFHVGSPEHSIKPLIVYKSTLASGQLFVRMAPGDQTTTLAGIAGAWKRFEPLYPFEKAFMEQRFEALLRNRARIGDLFAVFSLLAIVTACLGLFGLSAFTTDQRRKEIGIRKVLGASVNGILRLMSVEIVVLIAIGFLISAPVAWMYGNEWLDTFAYKISIGPGIFAMSAFGGIIVALAAVAVQSLKAARMNPVECLRDD